MNPSIKHIENLGNGKFKIDNLIYKAPQFLLNHVQLQKIAIEDKDKRIMELEKAINDLKQIVAPIDSKLQILKAY